MSRMTELPTGINVIDVIHIKTLSDCFWVHISGQRIDKLDGKHTAGKGTYSKNGFIIASLAGFVHHTQKDGDMVQYNCREI